MNDEFTFDDFIAGLGGGEDEDNPLFDPSQIITLRSTTGENDFTIPATEPTTIRELIQGSNLTVAPNIEYWVDGTLVDDDFIVAPGTTITAVGAVKGG